MEFCRDGICSNNGWIVLALLELLASAIALKRVQQAIDDIRSLVQIGLSTERKLAANTHTADQMKQATGRH